MKLLEGFLFYEGWNCNILRTFCTSRKHQLSSLKEFLYFVEIKNDTIIPQKTTVSKSFSIIFTTNKTIYSHIFRKYCTTETYNYYYFKETMCYKKYKLQNWNVFLCYRKDKLRNFEDSLWYKKYKFVKFSDFLQQEITNKNWSNYVL